MTSLHYHVKLVSDTETCSGLGSDLIDGLVAKDLNGKPFIAASHIKGLMRQNVVNLPSGCVTDELKDKYLALFGFPGTEEETPTFSVTDAHSDNADTRLISRTALNAFGVAKDTSLRTNEAIVAGSSFSGKINLSVESQAADLLIRYALLAIFEMGGSRNRGAGACVVTIDGENRTPGQILTELLAIRDFALAVSPVAAPVSGDQTTAYAQLTFVADASVCVPEAPIVGSNLIVSGFAVPASAVQGCLLTKINELNPNLATATFVADNFRTWPLLPIPSHLLAEGCHAVWASASHKISKLADENGNFNFADETIEPYDWPTHPRNAPIKSSDGVLIARPGQGTVLWRSGDMPRHLTAHGAVNSGAGNNARAFYTIEALAVRTFTGFVAMPENAMRMLEAALAKNPSVSLGKSRTVRGSGTLSLKRLAALPLALPHTHDGKEVAAFIVQSPLLVSPDVAETSADAILREMVRRAGWGEVDKASGTIQIRFGWNRRQNGLQKAQKVIVPGSVFSLKTPPADLLAKFVKGIGGGKERGFGAVLPHPNIADARHRPEPAVIERQSANDAPKCGWELWRLSRGSGNPLSSSQIAQLMSRISENLDEARQYLQGQLLRPDRVWERWKPVMQEILQLLEKQDSSYIGTALNVWHDLSVAED